MLICLYDSTEVVIVAAQTISTRSIGVYTGRQGAKTVQHAAAVCKMQDRAAHNERSNQVPGIHKYICAKHQSPQVLLGHNWKCRQQQSQDPMGFQAAEWEAATGWMTRHRGGWQEEHSHRCSDPCWPQPQKEGSTKRSKSTDGWRNHSKTKVVPQLRAALWGCD